LGGAVHGDDVGQVVAVKEGAADALDVQAAAADNGALGEVGIVENGGV